MRFLVSCLVWATYGISLVLPISDESDPLLGYQALSYAVMSPPSILLIPAAANVALLFGWFGYLSRMSGFALVAGLVAFGAALSTVPVLSGPHDPWTDVAASLGPGYWLWVGAMLVFTLGAAFDVVRPEG